MGTVPFMTAYWTTVGVLSFVACFITLFTFIELEGRKRAYALRAVLPVDTVLLLAILAGVWIPVFIPGLYAQPSAA